MPKYKVYTFFKHPVEDICKTNVKRSEMASVAITSAHTWQGRKQFENIDEDLDAVTDRIDHDNEDEDGGDKNVSALSLGSLWKKKCLLSDGDIDETVEDDQEDEGDEVDKDGENIRDLWKEIYHHKDFFVKKTPTKWFLPAISRETKTTGCLC